MRIHKLIAEAEDAFMLGKSKPDSTSMDDLVKAFSREQPLQLLEQKPYRGAGIEYKVATPKGVVRIVELTRDNEVYVDTSQARSNEGKAGGGAQIYQLVQTYAHNKGLKFRADESVSEIAQKRRISQMISSALRHGTTRHLKADHEFVNDATLDWQIDVPGWKDGEDDHNLALLLKKEHAYVMDAAQGFGIDLSHLTHDPGTDTIIDGRTGPPLTRSALGSLVDRLEPGISGVGQTTLLRALVTDSATRRAAAGGGVRSVLPDTGRHAGGAEGGGSDGWLVSVARHLYYSRPPEGTGSVPQRRVGDAVSGGADGLAATLAETARVLNEKQPGLINRRTHFFTDVESLLASDYAREHPFGAEDLAGLRTAEGFYDPETGHSVVIAENTVLREGETPVDALSRVVVHERVSHDGMNLLLGNRQGPRARRWAALSAQIPETELSGIAAESGYRHLAGNREALAFEWFSRQTESDPAMLGRDSLGRQMWDSFRELVADFLAALGKEASLGRSFETQVQDMKRRARQAALRGDAPLPRTRQSGWNNPDQPGLQFTQGGKQHQTTAEEIGNRTANNALDRAFDRMTEAASGE